MAKAIRGKDQAAQEGQEKLGRIATLFTDLTWGREEDGQYEVTSVPLEEILWRDHPDSSLLGREQSYRKVEHRGKGGTVWEAQDPKEGTSKLSGDAPPDEGAEATIALIRAARRVWAPIWITPRTESVVGMAPIGAGHPQPYLIVEGRIRCRGAQEAGIEEVPAVVLAGFSSLAQIREVGILANTARKAIGQDYRQDALHQLIRQEEERRCAEPTFLRSGHNLLKTKVGYRSNEEVGIYEKKHFYGRWLAYVSGEDPRLSEGGNAVKYGLGKAVPKKTPAERLSLEEALAGLLLAEEASRILTGGNIDDEAWALLDEAYRRKREENEGNPDPFWAWHARPYLEDCHRCLSHHHEQWAREYKEQERPPKDTKEDIQASPLAVGRKTVVAVAKKAGGETPPASPIEATTPTSADPKSPPQPAEPAEPAREGVPVSQDLGSIPATAASQSATTTDPREVAEESRETERSTDADKAHYTDILTEDDWNDYLIALDLQGGRMVERLVRAGHHLADRVKHDSTETEAAIGLIRKSYRRLTP